MILSVFISIFREELGYVQAPRVWYEKFSKVVTSLGCVSSHHDSVLFVKRSSAGHILLSLYVDDMIITGDDCDRVELLKTELSRRFAMKDLGLLRYFVGVEVIFYLSQSVLLIFFDHAIMTNNKIADIPFDAKEKYTPTNVNPLRNPSLYHKIVGSLVYFTVTRPSSAYVVHIVCQFVGAPTTVHWAAVLQILCESSTKAEYRAMDVTTSEIVGLPWLLADIGLLILGGMRSRRMSQPVNMEVDNIPALVLDESCLNQQNYSYYLMGKVKEISSLSNLKMVLATEGFDNIELKYMGGYWVMIEFQSEVTKKMFQTKVGTCTWFSQLQQASNEFTIDGRVTWVEIEGVPLRMCDTDDDSKEGNSKEVDVGLKSVSFMGGNSDVEEVSGTKYEEEIQNSKLEEVSVGQKNSHSEDPFNIYELLNKKEGVINKDSCVDDSVKYPPGFTPTGATGEHSNKGDESKNEGGENYEYTHKEEVFGGMKENCSNKISNEDVAELVCSGHFKKSEVPWYGYQEKDKNKDKTEQNRAREWNEREITIPTVPLDFIGPAYADHVGCQDIRRSTSGSMQLLGDRLVSWSSKRQKSAVISSTEAE
ncbi:uncharacterized mitochondrial protein-like protein [Tanacetum coccineum]